jgi:Zinc finger, C3HC4 type (RING finger)
MMEANAAARPFVCNESSIAPATPTSKAPQLAASPSTDISTLSSQNTMPPCAICYKGERTHIAAPCMHFSFCNTCVAQLVKQEASPSCPVCFEPNVSFRAVAL